MRQVFESLGGKIFYSEEECLNYEDKYEKELKTIAENIIVYNRKGEKISFFTTYLKSKEVAFIHICNDEATNMYYKNRGKIANYCAEFCELTEGWYTWDEDCQRWQDFEQCMAIVEVLNPLYQKLITEG